MGSQGAQCFWGLWLSDNRLWIPLHISKYAMATKLFIWYLLKFHPRDVGSSPNVKDYGFMWTPVSEGRRTKHPICAVYLCLLLNLIFHGEVTSFPIYRWGPEVQRGCGICLRSPCWSVEELGVQTHVSLSPRPWLLPSITLNPHVPN